MNLSLAFPWNLLFVSGSSWQIEILKIHSFWTCFSWFFSAIYSLTYRILYHHVYACYLPFVSVVLRDSLISSHLIFRSSNSRLHLPVVITVEVITAISLGESIFVVLGFSFLFQSWAYLCQSERTRGDSECHSSQGWQTSAEELMLQCNSLHSNEQWGPGFWTADQVMAFSHLQQSHVVGSNTIIPACSY